MRMSLINDYAYRGHHINKSKTHNFEGLVENKYFLEPSYEHL